MADMDMKGMNFTGTGALMNQEEMIAMRKKKGQCVTCGRQTHVKKMFKMIPITIVNEVQDGRCLKCRPLSDRLNSSMSGGVSTSGTSSKISRSVGSSTREAQAAAAFYEQFNAQLGSNAPNPVVMCTGNGQMMTVTSPPPPNGGSGHDHASMEQYPVGGPSPSPPRAGKPNTRFKTVTKQLMNINRISGAIGHQQHQPPQDNNHNHNNPSPQYHQHYHNDNDDRSVYSTQSYDQTRSNRGGSHRDRGSSRYIVESNQSLVSHTSGRSSAGGGGGGRHFVPPSSPPPHHHQYQSQAQAQRPLSPRSQMREMKLRRDYSRRRASLDDPYDQQDTSITADHEPQYFRQGSGSGSGTNIHSSSSFQQQQRHNSDRDRRRRSADAERVFDDGSPISSHNQQHGSNRSIPSRQDSGRSQRSERSSSGQSSLGQPRHHQSMYVDSGNSTGTRGASPSSLIDQQQQQQHKSMDLRGFLDRGGVIDSERFMNNSGGGGTRSMVGGGGGDSYRRNLRGNGTTHNRFIPQQQQQQPQSISSSQSYTGHYVGGSGNNNGSDRSLRSNPTPSSTAASAVVPSSQLRSSPSRKLSQIQSSGSIHAMGTSKSFDDTTPPPRGRDYDNRSRELSYNYNDNASFQTNHHSELSHRKLPSSAISNDPHHHLHGRYNNASRSSDNHNHVLEQSMNLDEITGTGTGALVVGNNNNAAGNTTPTSLSISQAMKVISNTNNPLDVLDLMREFATISRDVQVEGCHFFMNVVDPSSSNVRSAFYQLGGCDCVVTAMRLYPHDETLQKEACSVMEVYSRYCAGDLSSSLKMLTMDNPSNSNSSAVDAATEQPSLTFVQFGAVEWVAKAMKQFSQNVKLQTPAMAALANFSSSELLRSDIQECQCIPTIVSVMTTHCLDDQLQEVATACLANLSSSDSSFKKIISSSGGIDAICIAMVMHPNSVKLQQVGCRALRFLSASNEENKTKIESAGGIDSILSAMLIHQTLAGVVVEGLWALSNLAINKHNKVVIGESNGVEVIVKTMWAHGTVADVQELACRTLWTLSVNADNKSRVANQGGIKAIVNAMQTHSDHAGVQQNGCGCLANLAANSDNNKRLIVEGEGVDAVVMAMMLHVNDKVVQERAVNCVRKLAFEPHLEALRAAGVAALVEQAAQAFPSQCRAKADQVLGIL